MKTLVNLFFIVAFYACGSEMPIQTETVVEYKTVYVDRVTGTTDGEPASQEQKFSHRPTDAVQSIENLKVTYLSFSGYYNFHDVTTATEGDDVTVLRLLVENQGVSDFNLNMVTVSVNSYGVQVGPCSLYSHTATQSTVVTVSTVSWTEDGSNNNVQNTEWIELLNFSYIIQPGEVHQIEVHCGLHKISSNAIFIGSEYLHFEDQKPLQWTGAYTQVTVK